MTIVGQWELDHQEARGRAELGDVTLNFDDKGSLTYVVRGHEKDQIIKLRYTIDGDTIITDQPSAPRIERTAFSLEDDILSFALGGTAYKFRRIP
jgi:hypothetical protein